MRGEPGFDNIDNVLLCALFINGVTPLGDADRRGLVEEVLEHPVVEIAMAYIALISVIVVLAEVTLPLSPDTRATLYLVDAVAVGVLALDYVHRARRSGDPWGYARRTFYEIPALIPAVALAAIESSLAGAGLVRFVRVLRFLRIVVLLSRGSRFLALLREVLISRLRIGEVLMAVILTLFSGSFAVYLVESIYPNSQIKTFFDAIWWALATATTVGYGDVVPVTTLGRAIGIVMMLLGIALLSVVISGIGAAFYEYTLTSGREEARAKERLKDMIDRLEEADEEELELLLRKIRSTWKTLKQANKT